MFLDEEDFLFYTSNLSSFYYKFLAVQVLIDILGWEHSKMLSRGDARMAIDDLLNYNGDFNSGL